MISPVCAEFGGKSEDETQRDIDELDSTREDVVLKLTLEDLHDWTDPRMIESIQHRIFGFDSLGDEDGMNLDAEFNEKGGGNDEDDNDDDDDDDDEVYGDFEDLETGQVFGKAQGDKAERKSESASTPPDLDDLAARKLAQKEAFNTAYDSKSLDVSYDKVAGITDEDESGKVSSAEGQKQLRQVQKDEMDYSDKLKEQLEAARRRNQAAFEHLPEEEKAIYQGYHAGQYLKLTFQGIPYEMVSFFNAERPLIIGGLDRGEDQYVFLQVSTCYFGVPIVFGFVYIDIHLYACVHMYGCTRETNQARFKKHRWHRKVLKNRDPLVISLGWRRFQTIPVYAIEDVNGRHRMLKYTPEHMHCLAAFYAPMTPQNSGFVAFQTLKKQSGFRCAGTGVILEGEKSFKIVKKLKLVGYPYKVIGLGGLGFTITHSSCYMLSLLFYYLPSFPPPPELATDFPKYGICQGHVHELPRSGPV